MEKPSSLLSEDSKDDELKGQTFVCSEVFPPRRNAVSKLFFPVKCTVLVPLSACAVHPAGEQLPQCKGAEDIPKRVKSTVLFIEIGNSKLGKTSLAHFLG